MVPILARFRQLYEQTTLPLGRTFVRLGISPDAFTYLSLAMGVVTGILLANQQWLWSIVGIALVGLTDMLDGATARAGDIAGPYGTVLDHTVDRYVEFIILFGILFSGVVPASYIMFTMFGMVMASYVRARAESTGKLESCNVGMAGRQEKLALLLVGLVAQPFLPELAILQWAILAAGIISHITALQRLLYTRRMLVGSGPRRGLYKDPEMI
jgi:Phosphatidylglycerophosphate synthase